MKIGIMGANYVPPVEMSQPDKGRWLIVNLPRAIDLFARRSPFRKGLHLIIETGWDPKRMDLIKAEQLEAKKKRIDDGVAYLLRLRKNNYL